jgi:hypothetical protein
MSPEHIRYWSRHVLQRAEAGTIDLKAISAKLTSNPDDEFIRALLDLGVRYRAREDDEHVSRSWR